MKYFNFMMTFLLSYLNAFSQVSSRPILSIGDVVPDIKLSNIINYHKTEISLSELKGKLVILDFWASWCIACTKALPLLDSMQNTFGDKMKVFVVGYENPQTIKAFFNTNRVAKKTKLPVIAGDSLLQQLFPHHTLPHEVWIGSDGRLRAITDTEEITVSNIRKIMSEQNSELPEKKDLMTYTIEKPLLEECNGGTDSLILHRSFLGKHIEGLFSGFERTISKDSSVVRMTYINTPLLSLFFSAGMKSLPGANYLLVETSKLPGLFDTTRSRKEYNKWARDNTFCYELSVPVNTPESVIERKMQADINNGLGLNGRVEEREIKCFALVLNDKTLLQRKGGKTMSVLMEELNYQIPAMPLRPIIINETGDTGEVDRELVIDNSKDISDIIPLLRSHGFDLIPVNRTLQVFVISDQPIVVR